MKVLVTGGAGFIASHVADGYIEQGHDVAIVDDLSRGFECNLNPKSRFYYGNIMDRAFLEHVFEQERPEAINHHAAQMDVRRGVREPVFELLSISWNRSISWNWLSSTKRNELSTSPRQAQRMASLEHSP